MGFIADAARFFLYMIAVVILAWLSQALGLAIAAWFESPETGAGVAQILVLVFIVFGGLFSGFMPVSWIVVFFIKYDISRKSELDKLDSGA
jgi:hypothetical protein